MEWPSLEPWQAILAGAVLAPLVIALVYRGLTGRWDFTRAPSGPFMYGKWLASLMAGWLAFYYTPLFLGPHAECGDPLDLWGPWKHVWFASMLGTLLALFVTFERTRNNVDWCDSCREALSLPRQYKQSKQENKP